MAAVARNMSGPIQSHLTRSLERILEEAQLSGELKLIGRKLRDFPDARGKYNLSDTVLADLSKNRFGELPTEVTEYYFLERLYLYHNCVRIIPDSVVYLQCLTFLDLSRNQLSVIPSSLCQLPLEVLLLANNKLVALPEEIGLMKSLAELDASCNEITHLPPQLGEIPSLRCLKLRQNILIEIPLELMYLKLETLDISCNRIATIPLELRLMSTLVYLNVSNNPLTCPPASLCTRGRVHIFKYLELQAIKEDKKRGFLSDELRRVQKKVSQLSDLRLANGLSSDLRHKRLTVDSGYSTSDGMDKRWSQEGSEEDIFKLKGVPPVTVRIPPEPQVNGTCSGASTPSTMSPGENINMEEELGKAILLQEQLERRRMEKLEEQNKRVISTIKDGVTCVNGISEHVMNGKAVIPAPDERRPLEHIQTYREYKEALRQQRSQDVYRPRQPQEVHIDEFPGSNDSVVPQNKTEFFSNQRQVFEENVVNKRPVQKVIPSRNCSLTSQQNDSSRIPPTSNGNKKISPADSSCGLYIKPSSPIKSSTCLSSPGNPKLVTASVSFVPQASNGTQHRPPSLGNSVSRSPKFSPSRGMGWNRDIPPDKLSFTMRREFDKAREEAELIEQLRNSIETRLKMSLPEDMAPALSDGVVLCHLANHVRPRSVASIHVPSPAVPKLTMARCRRNVDNFLEACRKIGVEEALINYYGHVWRVWKKPVYVVFSDDLVAASKCCILLFSKEDLCTVDDVVEELNVSAVCRTVMSLVALEDGGKIRSSLSDHMVSLFCLAFFIGTVVLLYFFPPPN